MSSKNDIDGGRTDPFECLSRTIPLETYRMSSKLGDARLDRETTNCTASGWTDIKGALVRADVDEPAEDVRTTPTKADNFPFWNPMLEQEHTVESYVLDSDRRARADEKGAAGELYATREPMIDDMGRAPQTFARTVITISEEQESCNTGGTVSDIHSQGKANKGTDCLRETKLDALEESDSPRSIDRCAYSHVPMEDIESEDEKFTTRSEMLEESTCLPHRIVSVTLV